MADVKFKIVDATPTLLHVTHAGKTYAVRLALGILNVQATGAKDTLGNPVFSVTAGLNLNTEAEPVNGS